MTKRIFLSLLLIVLYLQIFSQAPEKFNYQAVIRDNTGELLINQDISFKISILDGSTTGSVIFSEEHAVLTNAYGIVNIEIGSVSGGLSSVSWESGDKFLKIEIDETGGSTYTELGVVQLLSVPYALYANDVADKNDADADSTNEIQDLDLTDDVLTITNHPSPTEINLAPFQGTNTDEQELTLLGDTLIISNGNEVVLPYDSSNWVISGDRMYYNGGNVGIGSSAPVSNLEVKANIVGSDALFQVINANNDTVFA
ncbi:MAG: hypothetical protein K8S16_13175, partial [Bacteroidales bacterium]|nr:hypothetical protein [Bacteroidales bacterium]